VIGMSVPPAGLCAARACLAAATMAARRRASVFFATGVGFGNRDADEPDDDQTVAGRIQLGAVTAHPAPRPRPALHRRAPRGPAAAVRFRWLFGLSRRRGAKTLLHARRGERRPMPRSCGARFNAAFLFFPRGARRPCSVGLFHGGRSRATRPFVTLRPPPLNL